METGWSKESYGRNNRAGEEEMEFRTLAVILKGPEGNLNVEGERDRGLKYFDFKEIFGRAVKGDSPRNRTSGM